MLRQDFDKVLERNIAFAGDKVKAGVLLHVVGIQENGQPTVKPLEAWRFPQEYKQYMDACIQRDKAAWSLRQEVHDDLLPCLKPSYGIAEHSSFVGGTVVYGGNTSYHQPLITSWNILDQLHLEDEVNQNFRLLLDSMQYLKERSANDGFLVTLRGGYAPSDLANALRGNELFTDLYDEPRQVHRLMEFCTKAIRYSFDHQLKIIQSLSGGVMSGWNIWMPGNAIGHLSEDASCLCSAEVYREFFKPYTQALLESYDCAMMHTHGMGQHVLPEIASLEKIKWIEITNDPNQERPIEIYKKNADLLAEKIVVVNLSLDELRQNQEFLSTRKTVVQLYTKTNKEAQTAVEWVRSM